MEVVEEDVIDAVAGKSVEQRPDDRIVPIFHEPPQIGVGSHRRRPELQHQKGRHQIGHGLAWEQQGQPEVRAPQQVERIGAHEISAQICVPVP